VNGGRLKSFITGEKIKKGKTRGRDHEHDGEVNEHGMGVAPEHGEARKEPGQGRGNLPFRGHLFLENAHLRISVKNFKAVRRCLDIGGEVFARVVPFHVKTALPQFAARDIDDLAGMGDIDRLFILSVELSEFFRAEFFDGPSPLSSNCRSQF
jgi:hypothetical protein